MDPVKSLGRGALRWLVFGVLPLSLLLGCGGSVEPPDMTEEARGDQCVEPLDVIRKDHGKILMEERDHAVRDGVRNPDHGFVSCIDCHVASDARHSEPETHFCASCHTFNAVSVDCFECHRDRPSASAHLHSLNPHAPAPEFAWEADQQDVTATLAETGLLLPPSEDATQ